MIRRPCLGLALALTALGGLASGALAQDARLDPPEPAPAPAPAAAPAREEIDTRVDLKGNRFRVTLKNGNTMVGVMPNGLVWERPDELGIYESAKEGDKGAGIRLYYILSMDGEFFIGREDIGVDDNNKLKIRDLGELTEAQKAEIRERILSDRRKVIEDREARIKVELARIAAEEEAAKKGAGGGEEGGAGGDGAKPAPKDEKSGEDEKAGDALLAKFPSPDWSEERLKEILRREVVNHIFRNDEEREFIDGFKLWKAALERKQKAEAEAEEKGGK